MRHILELTGESNSISQFVKSADMAALARIWNLKLTKLKVVIEQCDIPRKTRKQQARQVACVGSRQTNGFAQLQ